MENRLGYARVSTKGQDTLVQIDKLLPVTDRIYEEKLSGANRNRPELDKCLDHLRKGDTLVVTKLDRLARSIKDLHDIVKVQTYRY